MRVYIRWPRRVVDYLDLEVDPLEEEAGLEEEDEEDEGRVDGRSTFEPEEGLPEEAGLSTWAGEDGRISVEVGLST